MAIQKTEAQVIKIPKDKLMTVIGGMSNEGAKRNLVAWFYDKQNLAALANAPQGEIITVDLSKVAMGENPLANLNSKTNPAAQSDKQAGATAKAGLPQRQAGSESQATAEAPKASAVEPTVMEYKFENPRYAEILLNGIKPPKGEDQSKYKRLMNPMAEVG
jgi:hypothetical protein